MVVLTYTQFCLEILTMQQPNKVQMFKQLPEHLALRQPFKSSPAFNIILDAFTRRKQVHLVMQNASNTTYESALLLIINPPKGSRIA